MSTTSDCKQRHEDTSCLEKLCWVTPCQKVNSPIIHKEFTLDTIDADALLTISGLGYFEVYINNKKVSDDLMCPARTDYSHVVYKGLKYPFSGETRKSIMFMDYKVADYLKAGKNKISVWLGNGWYIQKERLVEGEFLYGDDLKTAFRLKNANKVIESDKNCYWTPSPIIYDNIFYGEVCDYRLDCTTERPVELALPPTGTPKKQLCPPDRIIHTYIPELRNGVYDATKCMTGFAQITARGKNGDKIKISYSERIDKDGNPDYTSTLGYEESDKNQIQADTVILKGGEDEVYVPRFVWHSFRYFKIEAPEGVIIKDVKVHYVCTDVKPRTKFSCSSHLLCQIHQISLNTQLTNTHGCMPMDCPHRERLGYTGDGQLSSLSVLTNFHSQSLYTKWADDIFDAQDMETGFVPHTAPFCGGAGGHGWGSAVAIVPWNIYLQYGDTEVLRKASPHIKKWLEYLITRRENSLVTFEQPGSWCLGEWCLPSKYPWSEPHLDEIKIPSELVNTFYFILCCNIYLDIADILGKTPDAWISQERDCSIDALNTLLNDGNYASGLQGSNILPLYLDIVPPKHREEVLANTINSIEDNGFRFQTGLAGTCFLFRMLDKYGRNDIALKMMLCTEYPGFGNMIKNGATALWETWEGNGSANHTAFSSADAWFTYGLAGLKPLGGYKDFRLEPYFAPELDYVNLVLESEYGEIAINWQRTNNGIEVEIKVPQGTAAHVNLKGKAFDLTAGTYKEVIE